MPPLAIEDTGHKNIGLRVHYRGRNHAALPKLQL